MVKLLSALFLLSTIHASAHNYFAKDFGVTGNGITDDGPAIQNAIVFISKKEGIKKLIFERGKIYYIKNIKGIYLFNFRKVSDIKIEGGNGIFLLDGKVRLFALEQSRNIVINNLSVDYNPLPFADGLIISKNQVKGYIDVKINSGFQMPPEGGPTNKPQEQAYFAMLWNKGSNSMIGTHFWVKQMNRIFSGCRVERILRVKASSNFTNWDKITSYSTRVSIPVRGIAHLGPYEVIRVVESENANFNNVNVWSAPWFAFGLARNKGELIFNNVNICPKPGTGRLTSSWRDGFHVSSNYAKLLWEDCRIEGTNDDAFNIQSFTSTLKEVISDTEITIRQNYPLNIVPYNQGDVLVVYDVVKGKILGKARVLRSYGFTQTGRQPAPNITLVMEHPISGMVPECQVWNESSANPQTILRRCRIYNSCRFQSSITIDHCGIYALSWFYGDNIEGPIPSNLFIKNSKLFVGGGNETIAALFSSNMSKDGKLYSSKQPVIFNVILLNNIINGELRIEHSDKISLLNNTFLLPRSKLFLSNCRNVLLKGNLIGNKKLNSFSQIHFMDESSEKSTTIWLDGKNDPDWLEPYNPDIHTPWKDYYGNHMDDFYWVMNLQYNRLYMFRELFNNSYLQTFQEDSIYQVKKNAIEYYGTTRPHLAPVLKVPNGFISNFKGKIINNLMDSVGIILLGKVTFMKSQKSKYPNLSILWHCQ